jgi:hypothetical protein
MNFRMIKHISKTREVHGVVHFSTKSKTLLLIEVTQQRCYRNQNHHTHCIKKWGYHTRAHIKKNNVADGFCLTQGKQLRIWPNRVENDHFYFHYQFFLSELESFQPKYIFWNQEIGKKCKKWYLRPISEFGCQFGSKYGASGFQGFFLGLGVFLVFLVFLVLAVWRTLWLCKWWAPGRRLPGQCMHSNTFQKYPIQEVSQQKNLAARSEAGSCDCWTGLHHGCKRS